MSAAGDLRKLWDRRIKDDATARGLRSVGGFVYQSDEDYLAVLIPIAWPDIKAGTVRLSWRAEVKPLVLDEILWAAFMPDQDLGGPRKRLNLRVNGAFTVSGLDLGSGALTAQTADDPGVAVATMLDEFERLRAEFVAAHPTLDQYRDAVGPIASGDGSRRDRLLQILTLMAAGDRDGAAAIADAEVAAGERGPMYSSSQRAGVFELLSLHCKPAEALAEFRARNTPTHTLEFISGTRRSIVLELAAGRDTGAAFGNHLRDFNGTDDFALILSPLGDRAEYLQAAGSGPDRITVEVCQPGGQQWGVDSVRYVIGRPGADGAPLDVRIELPTSSQTVGAVEVFGVDEAAELFTSYYRTGSIPECYSLRPAEGWAPDGTNVQLG
ncbi:MULTISPECIES: hypothetical protein [unclassified Mycolicibacterium]|uniref:hypothetical protein n=1 Tax=unclassified Mycolicibacterium TaxID=2636767 RepID=UPI0012DEAEC7|nr:MULTISPECIES: hypothetical protein [unclassified Mycolicibacterium]MUL81279.1 hypothetical protein [Mycolicibacterium sp. CBMA 329]MUL87045.1 hypothetical protein [Mycolicibacterium sp. CBMA 331]MUL98672.1 hypothetical protein [Mycolicibacterium sp. CBMA 334]MUM29568.1 hypothetical protein [Mycolicibacterium sp. CBMA 295]MUM37342.1 hypothetical protein [Mycolicibacterium sp. CBMA 247]